MRFILLILLFSLFACCPTNKNTYPLFYVGDIVGFVDTSVYKNCSGIVHGYYSNIYSVRVKCKNIEKMYIFDFRPEDLKRID